MRLFRIGKVSACGAEGCEFEVPDDATEERIAEAAHDAIIERISYGWQEVTSEEEPCPQQ